MRHHSPRPNRYSLHPPVLIGQWLWPLSVVSLQIVAFLAYPRLAPVIAPIFLRPNEPAGFLTSLPAMVLSGSAVSLTLIFILRGGKPTWLGLVSWVLFNLMLMVLFQAVI